jgi:GNAT superfamily N-acetyltransferase
MTKKLEQITITPKTNRLEDLGTPNQFRIPKQKEEFEAILYRTEEITNDPELLNSLAKLVQEGLTIYGENFDSALEDLKQHLENAQTAVLFDYKGEAVGFGIYKSLNSDFLDISFVVAANHQRKGLGSKLIQIGANNFSHRYIVASTQNVATFMAFKKAFGENLLAPVLKNGKLEELEQSLFAIASDALKLKGGQGLNPDGSISSYYPESGLYNENINQGSEFPINAQSSQAVIIVAKNPNFK